MDLFEHRHYKVNKVLLICMGLWPYRSTRAKTSIVFDLLCVGSSIVIAQMQAIIKYHDWDSVMESAASLIYDTTITIALVSVLLNSQKILKLFNRIRTDWEVWSEDQEANILHEYAEKGRKMTIIIFASVLFVAQPISSKIIDILLRNGSEPGEFAMPVDYHPLDMQKYYFYISFHCFVCVTLAGLFATTIASMFMVFVFHGCALFAAIGKKIQRIGINEKNAIATKTMHLSPKKDMDIKLLALCVARHNDAIEYAALIEATFSWGSLFIVGSLVLMISTIGFQILRNLNDPHEIVRLLGWLLGSIGQLYVNCYMSQLLMDHSISIRYFIHNSEWYRLSQVAQKHLMFMSMRCNVPCKLTAGKICDLSLQNFVAIMKTSLSYLAVLRSVQ